MTAPARRWLEDLDEIDRVKIAINPHTNCWEWLGAIQGDGYGQAKRSGRVVKAHRHIYETLVGPLAQNVQHLDHRCRVRRCVNPDHLEPVTPMDNIRRGLPAISAQLPDDLVEDVLALVEKAYKRGVLDGIRQAGGRIPLE